MSFEPNTQFVERYHEFLEDCDSMSWIPRYAQQLFQAMEYEELGWFMDKFYLERDHMELARHFNGDEYNDGD